MRKALSVRLSPLTPSPLPRRRLFGKCSGALGGGEGKQATAPMWILRSCEIIASVSRIHEVGTKPAFSQTFLGSLPTMLNWRQRRGFH